MKKIIPGFIVILILDLITGCSKDSASDIRDIFVATYSVTESWTENSKTITKPAYSMSVEKSSQDAGKILLKNFADYGAGITAEATISGNNLSMPQQTLSNLKAINGTGSLSGSTLSFTYTESINSVSVSISATAIKK
jgi:hypothetical protein